MNGSRIITAYSKTGRTSVLYANRRIVGVDDFNTRLERTTYGGSLLALSQGVLTTKDRLLCEGLSIYDA